MQGAAARRPLDRFSMLAGLGLGLPLAVEVLTLAFTASRRGIVGSDLTRLGLTLVLVGFAWKAKLWARWILVLLLGLAAPLAVAGYLNTAAWPLLVLALFDAVAAVCLFAAWGPELRGPGTPRRSARPDDPPLPDPR